MSSIKLNDKYEVNYKDGYFIVSVFSIAGEESKEAGKRYKSGQKSFATLLGAHKRMTELGVDGNVFMQTADKLLNNYCVVIKPKKERV